MVSLAEVAGLVKAFSWLDKLCSRARFCDRLSSERTILVGHFRRREFEKESRSVWQLSMGRDRTSCAEFYSRQLRGITLPMVLLSPPLSSPSPFKVFPIYPFLLPSAPPNTPFSAPPNLNYYCIKEIPFTGFLRQRSSIFAAKNRPVATWALTPQTPLRLTSRLRKRIWGRESDRELPFSKTPPFRFRTGRAFLGPTVPTYVSTWVEGRSGSGDGKAFDCGGTGRSSPRSRQKFEASGPFLTSRTRFPTFTAIRS